MEGQGVNTAASLEARLQDRMEFSGIEGLHREQLQALKAEVLPELPRNVASMYQRLRTVPELSEKLGSAENERRVSRLFQGYVEQMFEGVHDVHYLQTRMRIGVAHDRIGLGPHWFLGAYGHLFRGLIEQTLRHRAGDVDAQMAVLDTLFRTMFFDLGLVLETYEATGTARRQAMVDRFVTGLTGTTESLTTTTEAVETVVQDQQKSVAETAAAVAEVTSSLSELRQTSSQSLEHATELMEVVETASSSVRTGTEAAQASTTGLRAICEQVESIQDTIQALVEHTNQIGDIITTVNEIAEQSKLLALNASIEAARAGEYGRSFSVVANEMRDLAEQSKQATRQVRTLLSDISNATASAVLATEGGLQYARDGETLADQVVAMLEEIEGAVQRTEDASRLIASASRQQQAGVSQVADAMVHIDQTTRATAVAMDQLTDAVSVTTASQHDISAMIGEFGG